MLGNPVVVIARRTACRTSSAAAPAAIALRVCDMTPPPGVCTHGNTQFHQRLDFLIEGSRFPGGYAEFFEILEHFRKLVLKFFYTLPWN